jgi:pterin-4a-carbinolamine dehydratase
LAGPARRRGLRNHPQWQVIGERLVREWRFVDFAEALGLVERLANDVEGVGRRSDICLLGGNRVRVTVVNPYHGGVTVAELRTVDQIEATAERYTAELAAGAAAPRLDRTRADSHERPLGA